MAIQVTDVLADPLLSPLLHHLRPKIAQAILGMGRSKMYEALGRGELTAVKDGAKTLITVESIREYQARRPVAKFTPPPARSMDGLNKLNETLRAKAAAKRTARRRRGGR
jgi:Helix-turn-helix domain